MISGEKKLYTNSVLYINLIFAFFPISFVFGNLLTNANLIIFCVYALLYLKSSSFTAKFNFSLKVIFLLFLFVFFSTALSFIKSAFFQEQDETILIRLIKSLLFFRFFLLLLIIYILNELEIINFKYFFISATFVVLFIALDVIFQYILGYNILGFESYIHHNTSFFKDELISGGYIQNFSFFSLLYLSYLFRNNNILNTSLIAFATCILGIAILVSGNRFPFVLFLLGILLLFILNKKLRKKISLSFIILIFASSLIIFYDSQFRSSYFSLYQNMKSDIISLSRRMITNEEKILKEEKKEFQNYVVEVSGHRKIISTAIETWKLHKFFGNGIKSFRVDCQKIILKQKRGMCSNHPHNYYMEILTDLGIVGFIIVILIALLFLDFLKKNYKTFNSNRFENLFLLAAVVSLFLEVFPIKSSGSIFTTNNATYIILMSAIILAHKKILEGKNL